jgi:hypothetical protein
LSLGSRFEDLAESAVADPVCLCELFVLAEVRRSLFGDLSHSRVRKSEACTSIRKLDVVDEEVLSDVVGLAVVEVAEELQEVVPA